MKQLAQQRPRYGYRRITKLLRREAWKVNRKRIHRLWKLEGLKVPQKQRKRRRLGSSDNGVVRRRPEYLHHVWSYDFIEDQTSDGRRLKMLPVLDEFSRQSLTIEVERHITAQDVIATLTYLFEIHGPPEYIRSDNGPEFIATAVKDWLKEAGVQTIYIEPGSPWQNAYSESFNSRFRDELLDREVFMTLREAKVLVEDHRVEYNEWRPHSSLDYETPATFAAACALPGSATLRQAEHTQPPTLS